MRHRVSGRKLKRTTEHRLRLFRSMAESLFKAYQIVTTVEKAKEARPFVERLITLARRGDSQAQRQARRSIEDRVSYMTLFEKIGPLNAERKGGYTRILRLGRRPGDGAEMAVFELVGREQLGVPPGKPQKSKKAPKEKEGAGAR